MNQHTETKKTSQKEAASQPESPFEGVITPPNAPQFIALASGKGGVGKSLIASSLSISLSRLGHRVVAADLDLGGANLHTALGLGVPQRTISDFIAQRVGTLGECLTKTEIPNLQVLSGAQDSVTIARLDVQGETQLLQGLVDLQADFVVMDLGAGTSLHTLDFFVMARDQILTVLPEPTSVENAYRFLKAAYYRRLKIDPKLRKIRPLVDMAGDSNNPLGLKTPADLYKEVAKNDPESAPHLKHAIQSFQPKLIVNQARTQTDVDLGASMKSVCKRYFGIKLDFLGYLDYDSVVWQAIRRKRPMVLEFPNSRLVASLEDMARNLARKVI